VLENVLVSPILARRIGDRAPRTSQPRRPGPAPGPRTPSRGDQDRPEGGTGGTDGACERVTGGVVDFGLPGLEE
jgi:hypothetical protein